LGLRPKPHNCVELVGRPSRRLGRQCSPLAGTLQVVQRPTGGSATSHLGRWDVAGGNTGDAVVVDTLSVYQDAIRRWRAR
jgi:hypothetical protein